MNSKDRWTRVHAHTQAVWWPFQLATAKRSALLPPCSLQAARCFSECAWHRRVHSRVVNWSHLEMCEELGWDLRFVLIRLLGFFFFFAFFLFFFFQLAPHVICCEAARTPPTEAEVGGQEGVRRYRHRDGQRWQVQVIVLGTGMSGLCYAGDHVWLSQWFLMA